MDFAQIIKTAITNAIPRLGDNLAASPDVVQDFSLTHPPDLSHGDYASNIALLLYPKLTQLYPAETLHEAPQPYTSPRALAEAIKTELLKDQALMELIDRVEVAGAGFINFFIKPQVLVKELDQITLKQDQYGSNAALKGQKVLTEFTDPNPFKQFHIGHLYSNTVGESLSRILSFHEAELKRANYQGDVGMHVAKSLWGLKKKLAEENKQLEDLDGLTIKEKVTYLGQAYALGAAAYEANETAKQEIKDINTAVYQQQPEIMNMYQKGRQWSLDYFETIYRRLGTKFDHYFFESEVGPVGLQFAQEQLEKGIFEKSDGAIVFKGEPYGLHTRVFVNAQDLPTYEAKDLGLAVIKYQTYAYDRSIIITANEIDEYFKVILKVLSLIRPDLAEKTKHISHGMVKLPEGKMSSRTGKVVAGEALLDTVKETALEVMKQGEHGYSDQEMDEISEVVAIGAIKYAFLKGAIGKDIIYDINASLSLQGNSGPYIQYTHARCRSVIEKGRNLGIYEFRKLGMEKKIEDDTADSSLFSKEGIPTESWREILLTTHTYNPEELSLLRYLYRFPEVVTLAGAEFAPHHICTYLYELAQKYNGFYNKHSILQPTTNNQQLTTKFRLLLTEATSIVLKNGLHLLGIQAPERM